MQEQEALCPGHQCPHRNASFARVLSNSSQGQVSYEARHLFAATDAATKAASAGSKTSAMNRLRFKSALTADLNNSMSPKRCVKKCWLGSTITKSFASFLTRLDCFTWTELTLDSPGSDHPLSASFIGGEALGFKRSLRSHDGAPQKPELSDRSRRPQHIFDAADALGEFACF